MTVNFRYISYSSGRQREKTPLHLIYILELCMSYSYIGKFGFRVKCSLVQILGWWTRYKMLNLLHKMNTYTLRTWEGKGDHQAQYRSILQKQHRNTNLQISPRGSFCGWFWVWAEEEAVSTSSCPSTRCLAELMLTLGMQPETPRWKDQNKCSSVVPI